MSFNPDNTKLDDIWASAIKPAIKELDCMPFRIDEKEPLNRIDDAIIAAIRKCRFVIADFTEQKQNVYYESGFAMALNKPVIFTIEKSEINDLHFDIRQYPFIKWSFGDNDTFKKEIKDKIGALLSED